MLGLINTRPTWNDDDDHWASNLRFELNNVEVMDAPLQILSLTDSVNVGNQLFSWLSVVNSKKSTGHLIFTSPSSVKALGKHLIYFDNIKKRFINPSEDHNQIIKSLVTGINERRIKAATIGIGTKQQLKELINNLIPIESNSKNLFFNELVFVKDNADTLSFLQSHQNKFTNENLLVFEGEGNKPTLVNGLRAHTKEIISLSLYIRRYQKLPDLVSFYHKVISKNTLTKDAIDFNKQVFLLLSSSSIANLAKKELKKQKVMLNSLVVLSHHDRIIEVMKEECHDLTFSKIISLSPKLIADEVKKRLV